MKKFISVLLSLLMVFSLCSSVSADDGRITTRDELQSALDNGGTVSLTDDVDASANGLTVKKDVTLDLNGHSLKVANSNATNIKIYGATFTLMDSTDTNKDGTGQGKIYTEVPYAKGTYETVAISVNSGAHFIMESGLIDTASAFTDNSNQGQFAVGLNDGNATVDANITINGGHIKAGWYAVAGNGGCVSANHNITVNGGILESVADYAIYHPQSGTTTINDGIVYGYAGGIAINRGNLVVNGGTITSKGVGSTGTWGDGTGKLANAAVNINAKYGTTDVKLNNGRFIAEGNAISLIKDLNHPSTLTIAGGTYSSDISEYLPNDLVQNANGKVVAVVSIGDKNFDSLTEAISAANNGDTITLNLSTTEDIVIPKGKTLTIDILEGVTLTNNNEHTIINNGNLTITGKGTIDNVTHGRGDIVNNYGATLVLKGEITLTRSKEAGSSTSSSGGNSWYNISNQGTMEIYDNVSVISTGSFSSLIRNGEGKENEEAILKIYGGKFSGGINTIKNGDFGKLYIEDGEFLNSTQATLLNWNYAEINGGTFKPTNNATDAVITGLWKGKNYDTEGKTIITCGDFYGSISLYDEKLYPGQGFNGDTNILGGSFSEDVSMYLVPGNNVVYINNRYGILKDGEKISVTSPTPTVDETTYDEVKKVQSDSNGILLETDLVNALQSDEKDMLNKQTPNNVKLETVVPLDINLYSVDENGTPTKITSLNSPITINMYLPDDIVNSIKNAKTIKVARFHGDVLTMLDATLNGNILTFKTDKFSTYAIVAYGTVTLTSSVADKKAGPKDLNSDGVITCDEEMGSKNWIWSETKGACVYKVSNTSTK